MRIGIDAETCAFKFSARNGKWIVKDHVSERTYENERLSNVVLYALSNFNHLSTRCLRCQKIIGKIEVRKETLEPQGRCVTILTIEENAVVITDSPDWSSGCLYHRFPKTMEGLARALEYVY